ncbi:MAG: YcxB family protein [Firmicutes bacterium]|nr:YcxB family protein [Bacillota bacterium]
MDKTTTLKLSKEVQLFKFTREILIFSLVMFVFMLFLASPGIAILIAGFHLIVGLCFVFIPVGGVIVATIIFIALKSLDYSVETMFNPEEQKIVFNKNIIIYSNDKIILECNYKDFFKVTSSKNYHHLFLSKFKFFLIDKKDFSYEELNALQNKIKNVK